MTKADDTDLTPPAFTTRLSTVTASGPHAIVSFPGGSEPTSWKAMAVLRDGGLVCLPPAWTTPATTPRGFSKPPRQLPHARSAREPLALESWRVRSLPPRSVGPVVGP